MRSRTRARIPSPPEQTPQESNAVKSAVETLNPTRVKLTVEVPFDELKPSLDAAYTSISKQVTVPGFRKGHVPPRIIDQRVGRGAVIEEAVNEALPRFYAQAVEESDVRPLGQPTVDVTEVPDPAKGGELKFTAEVDVRPEIELPDLEGIAVTVDDVEISDADVDTRLDDLRQRFGTLVGVDRAAQTGDFVSLDISATIEGEQIDSVTGVSYEVGSGQMLEGMDEAVTGLQAGETATFTAPLAGGDRAGQDAEVTVTVQSVKERELPAADDDFAQLASEFDTLDELRDDLRTQVEQVKRVEQGMQAREKLLEHLAEVVEVPVPEGIVADEVHRHLEGEGRLEDDEHRAEVEVEARKAFQQQLLLDAVAEKVQVSVNQQELVEYIVASAQQYGMDPNAFAKAVDEAGQVPAMVSEVARRKALAVVLEKAKVTDASGREVDLSTLFTNDDEVLGEEPGDQPQESVPPVASASVNDPTALPSIAVADFEPDDAKA
ncbi:MAG TPA: trigger factor [Kineosporiaceae bacterium]|nr:trigger factor [Kineosporiaceae bacterium]